MGCDIHAVFQAKVNGVWVDVPSNYEQGRHYALFSWLAGVRNGGSHAIVPIAERRGLPADFKMGPEEAHQTSIVNVDPRRAKYLDEGECASGIYNMRMGDHSYSWLSLDEILSAKLPSAWRAGIVHREFFDSWDGHTAPPSYSQGIWGPGVSVADSPTDLDERSTHVRVWWREEHDFQYFLDEIKRLQAQHGECRMVFGFDS